MTEIFTYDLLKDDEIEGACSPHGGDERHIDVTLLLISTHIRLARVQISAQYCLPYVLVIHF
jgi:hypothetical protein